MTGATTEDARGYDHDPHNDRKLPTDTDTDTDETTGYSGEVADRDEADEVVTGHAHVTGEDDPAGSPVTAEEAERAATGTATTPADDGELEQPGRVYDRGTPVDDTAPDTERHTPDPHASHYDTDVSDIDSGDTVLRDTGFGDTGFGDTAHRANDPEPGSDSDGAPTESDTDDEVVPPLGSGPETETEPEPGSDDENAAAGIVDAPDTGPAGVAPAEVPVAAQVGGDENGKWWPGDVTGAVMERWREAQIAFVDDPAAAVREGRAAVEDAVRHLTEALATRVDQLSGDGDGGDTERLRQVMRGYHRLLDRLVEL